MAHAGPDVGLHPSYQFDWIQVAARPGSTREAWRYTAPMEKDSSILMHALQERLLGELKSYAEGRKAGVLRNAETEALAGLLLEKFGYGLATAARIAAELLDVPAPDLITEVERSVEQVDPRAKNNREKRRAARPAGISIKQ
jgi:hypothetical protein